MIRRRHMRVVAGLVLAAGLAIGSGAASAHPGPKHGKPAPAQTKTAPGHTKTSHGENVTGSVIGVGTGSLTVQTPAGTVTVAFDNTTHVVKIVAGTLADVSHAHVNLHFAKHTTTVDGIKIQPTPKKPAPTTTKTPPAGKGPHHPTVSLTGTPTAPIKHPKHGAIHDGLVIATTTTTITVQGRGGQTATYNLANNLSIIMQTVGTTNDFKIGQTIRAHGPATGPARDIVILKGS